MAVGYVYILLNPSMPGYLKIGKTDRTSEERAAELSAVTGIPTKFHVAFDVLVSDCDAVEQSMHKRFARQRASENREFFCLSLKEAIAALSDEAIRFLPKMENDDRVSESPSKFPSPPTPRYRWKTISDDGVTLLKKQYDLVSVLVRYTSRRRTAAVAKNLPGFDCNELGSKWVSLKTSPDAALDGSLISLVPESDGGQVHYDMTDGGYCWVHECPDQSFRSRGFEVHSDVGAWQVAVKEKHWSEALAVAERILKEYPCASLGYLNKAVVLHELRNTSEAKSTLLAVAESFPREYRLAYNLACYECTLGNLQAAKNWLKRAKAIVGKDKIRQSALQDPDLRSLSNYVRSPIWW
jgi:hypothetical protein